MKLVYIAGRYRAKTLVGRLWNIWKARRAAKRLSREGWCVVCPHMNTAMLDGHQPDSFWLDCGLELLARCNAIYMLEGWQWSVGACREWQLAKELELDIYYDGVSRGKL